MTVHGKDVSYGINEVLPSSYTYNGHTEGFSDVNV